MSRAGIHKGLQSGRGEDGSMYLCMYVGRANHGATIEIRPIRLTVRSLRWR